MVLSKLFHKKLRYAEKLFEKSPKSAIKILEEHRKQADGIIHTLSKVNIYGDLQDYLEVIGSLINSIKQGDMHNAHAWVEYLEGRLKSVNRAMKKLEEYVLLE